MRINNILRIAKDNCLLVLAYYLFGHLSMYFLVTPPSNAAAIWPPAGIALAAVLVRGNRVLPAVFLGGLIIAIELFGFGDFFSIAFALMVGFQAMLSAWMGSFLVSITIGRHDSLIDNRSILLFLCLAGPISQSMSAALAVSVEFWLGMIGAEDIVYSMFTWWVGSSIGVILFAPLGLICFGYPRDLWRSRIIPVALPMLILFLTGVWFFNSIKLIEQQRLVGIFEQKIEHVHQEIRQEGLKIAEHSEEIGSLMNVLHSVSDQEFTVLTRALLKQRRELVAIAWVGDSYRLAGQGKEQAGEFDLIVSRLDDFTWSAKQAKLQKILMQAAQSGNLKLVRLSKNHNHNSLVALVIPVYRFNQSLQQSAIAVDNLLGQVVLFMDYQELKQSAIDYARRQQIELDIVEYNEFSSGSETERLDYGFDKTIQLSVLDNVWFFNYRPTAEFISRHTAFSYWWIFVAGFCVMSLFGFILLSVTGQTLRTQRQVDTKTAELNNKNRLLDSVLNNVREGIVACNTRGAMILLNRTASQQFGVNSGHTCNQWMSGFQAFSSDGKTPLKKDELPLQQALRGKEVNEFEMIVSNKEDVRSLLINSQPLTDENAKIIGAVASFQDITRQKKFVNELKKLSLAVKHSPNAIMMTDAEGIIEYVNAKFSAINGYLADEIIGQKPSILKSGRTPPNEYKALWESLLQGNDWAGEFLNRKRNGQMYWAKQFIAPVKNEQGRVTHFVSIIEDSTEERKKAELISYQANHDDLTGLLNRRECEKRLQRVLQNARETRAVHVFCFLDLDKFKVVNDTCGHLAGDDLLKGVSDLLRQQIRQRDTLARLGGDEFGIIMEHCSAVQAREVAKEICREVAAYKFYWQDECFNIGVSIGLTEINCESEDYLSLIAQADKACYQVKESGRGQVAIF